MSYDNLVADPNLLTCEALAVPSDQVPIMKFGMAKNICSHTRKYTHIHTDTNTHPDIALVNNNRPSLPISGPDTYTSLENY